MSDKMLTDPTPLSHRMYLVGGAVRDIVMGRDPKDFDFACEFDSFEEMRAALIREGFEIFLETPQYFTIRARAKNGFTFAGRDMGGKTYDFALCREEAGYTDGRRPDTVKPATILSDLSRRDFTMNAMAMDYTGKIIDPFNGKESIKRKVISCVGRPQDRFNEDPLRVARLMRFSVQLGFHYDSAIGDFLASVEYPHEFFRPISTDRIRDELTKMFKADTWKSFDFLSNHPLLSIAIERGIWFMPTNKGK